MDKEGNEEAYSYREARMVAAAIAHRLRDKGVQRGDVVAVDLPNCPAYVFLILAAAYGGFSLATVNHRLSEHEKIARILELERNPSLHVSSRVDAAKAAKLFDGALAYLSGETAASSPSSARSFIVREEVAAAGPRSARGMGRAAAGRAGRRRREEVARQDAVEGIIHFAEHSAHLFDNHVAALVMFTSGTTGRPKAVSLTWANLMRSAEASNASLNKRGEGLWQVALPLFHVGGFQMIMRSILNRTPFVLYEKFDAARVLSDAVRCSATHISVVDKMLQDLLSADDGFALARYSCILLGGGALNPATARRVLQAKARVYASYGMTETSSHIAHELITPSFHGGMRLLQGYDVHVVDPGEDGFGRLAVRGPGVFAGYLNARAAMTVDGFFLTGDTAALFGGRLFVKERTSDMFVSGGENIYPAEIRDELLRIPGVDDAYVFGVPDDVWGRRPIAFVEHPSHPNDRAGAHVFAAHVESACEKRLSKLYRPEHVCAVEAFPRTGIGKIDRAALEKGYEDRIEVDHIVLYRIRLPFKEPFKTAKGVLSHRESVIVEVTDHAGRVGLGECVAFPTDWYLPETLDQDIRVMTDILAPLVARNVFLHPREVSALFASYAEASRYPLACGAIEPALWDLYGKIIGQPLWKIIGGSSGSPVPAGAVIGIGSVAETVAAVRRCVDAGYRRVKMKVSPGSSLPQVKAVRTAFPDLMITLDANQSFTERDLDQLRQLDACDVAWIEEPLSATGRSVSGSSDLFVRLAQLQRLIETPICLDESIARPRDLMRALGQNDLRCYAVKIGKFGGVQPTLDFVRLAQARGIKVWMSGMYDTGISRRLHAAFETLPGMRIPGDIGATARYFDVDVTDPPYTVERGSVTLDRRPGTHGLGCSLNRAALAKVLVERIVVV